MISSPINSELLAQYCNAISDTDVKDAFRYLIGLAVTNQEYIFITKNEGEEHGMDICWTDTNIRPYSVMIENNSLIFYIRHSHTPPFSSFKKEKIKKNFDITEDEFVTDEIKFKIRNLQQAIKVCEILF